MGVTCHQLLEALQKLVLTALFVPSPWVLLTSVAFQGLGQLQQLLSTQGISDIASAFALQVEKAMSTVIHCEP